MHVRYLPCRLLWELTKGKHGETKYIPNHPNRSNGYTSTIGLVGDNVKTGAVDPVVLPTAPARCRSTTPGALSSGELRLSHVPSLSVAERRGSGRSRFDLGKPYKLRYRAKSHRDLPHVVKFSGGRSSGMLLFTLLENRILDAERGDVIIFNNTSAEHPNTYRFARDCAKASERYGIPFFWVEYQTYEDARNGEWTRLNSYRLVNRLPRSRANPDGFHWRGEVFEELLSWSGYLPNQFRRICTRSMKLETTRAFMADWLGSKESIPRLGHFDEQSRLDVDHLYWRHVRNGGGVPKDIFLRKREFALTRPHVRPAQRYADYCPAWTAFENPTLNGKAYGGQARFGKGGAEYLAFVGLRGDEDARVERVRARNGPGSSGHTGEHVYMPLADMRVSRADANAFWDRQDWDLALPSEGTLSNCVYCFLKGGANLRSVHGLMEEQKHVEIPGFGLLAGTPCDFDWWARIERMYGRDLKAENRQRRTKGAGYVGFAGNRGMLFERIAEGMRPEVGVPLGNVKTFGNASLPCDCTE